ncbi:MAG: hypothetical protein O4804_07025, partial [Trichodesmium sp. St11_bin5]|nr:hypothetical protein [Trichodesmium sp. St11_bin5]
HSSLFRKLVVFGFCCATFNRLKAIHFESVQHHQLRRSHMSCKARKLILRVPFPSWCAVYPH